MQKETERPRKSPTVLVMASLAIGVLLAIASVIWLVDDLTVERHECSPPTCFPG